MIVVRQIHGQSMMPVLRPGQYIFAWRWFIRLKVGDVVVIQHQGLEKIKRIHSIDGERIEVRGDNTAFSMDSRNFGSLNKRDVIAKLLFPVSK